MKLKYFSYNAFVIEDAGVKIAIDPGLNLWIGKLNSLIPESEWRGITHIVVTHGDPDHYWYADRMARASRAPLICGQALVKHEGAATLLLDPRRRGVHYSTVVDRLYPLAVGETIDVDGVRIEGLKTVHGPLVIPLLFGLLKHTIAPGPGERIGLGAMGFKLTVGDTTLVNLGDTLIQPAWEGQKADVLLIPIGGRLAKNTMNEDEALEAVQYFSPRLVVPCHYGGDFFWMRNVNVANVRSFQERVQSMGIECRVMAHGDGIVL